MAQKNNFVYVKAAKTSGLFFILDYYHKKKYTIKDLILNYVKRVIFLNYQYGN
jgi:hypothetical protein